MTRTEFDQIRLDALREILSIATGNAATSLSTMIGKRVDITVPNVMVEAIEKIPEVLGGREKKCTVVYFSVSGQVSGSIFLILSSSESLRLANMLTGRKETHTGSLGEMELSALKELGNILSGSYIMVLSQELKLKTRYSIPGLASDMLGAIFDEILAHLFLEAENAVIMESEFIVRGEVSRGHLVLILPLNAVNTIIKALGNWGK
ncbi:MAG: chemotaxis protein CheC [Deltaproteobacteria bacterium]|nr:chemotaxis protein CheC [Deltaproteobacteria bacterium]